MAIQIKLDIILKKRYIKSDELAEVIGITTANLSILKTGKAKAIRFSSWEAICGQPGDILAYNPETE
ncbi:transcriptional regulator [Gramella sp. BOM4]|nr:transcriptional regulator [Christiangramia bathymodioli]